MIESRHKQRGTKSCQKLVREHGPDQSESAARVWSFQPNDQSSMPALVRLVISILLSHVSRLLH